MTQDQIVVGEPYLHKGKEVIVIKKRKRKGYVSVGFGLQRLVDKPTQYTLDNGIKVTAGDLRPIKL